MWTGWARLDWATTRVFLCRKPFLEVEENYDLWDSEILPQIWTKLLKSSSILSPLSCQKDEQKKKKKTTLVFLCRKPFPEVEEDYTGLGFGLNLIWARLDWVTTLVFMCRKPFPEVEED